MPSCAPRSPRSSSASDGRPIASPSSCSAPTSPAPGVREAVQATLDLARGLGLANLLTDDSRRRARIVEHWVDTLERTLAAPTQPV